MSDYNRATQILNNASGVTLILEKSSGRKTKVMTSENVFENELPEARLNYENNINGYNICSVISENTGEAALYLVEKDGANYVLKLFHKGKSPKDEILDKIKNLDCLNVIPVLETGYIGEKFYMLTSYYKNGDLTKHLPLDEDRLRKYIIPSINNGINALHDIGIIHRDIKPSNIFISDDETYAVIGDFGISSIINENISVRATSMSRTLGYAAPETSAGFISKESDFYSFGITLLHSVTGRDPFEDMTEMQIMYQTINKKLEIPDSISSRMKKLITGLTAKDREERLGHTDVLNWLMNKEIIVNQNSQYTFGFKFNFNGQEYTDLNSLAYAFSLNWKETEKYLFRGIIEEAFKGYDDGMYWECGKLRRFQNKDIAVFRLIYLLNPMSPLVYKKKNYKNIENLRKCMNDYDNDTTELISNGLLSYYLEINGYSHNIIKQLDLYSEKIKAGKKEFFYAVKFLLSEEKAYKKDDMEFFSADDCIKYLSLISDSERIEDVSLNLINDDMFIMWLCSLGYCMQVEKWQGIYDEAKWED